MDMQEWQEEEDDLADWGVCAADCRKTDLRWELMEKMFCVRVLSCARLGNWKWKERKERKGERGGEKYGGEGRMGKRKINWT